MQQRWSLTIGVSFEIQAHQSPTRFITDDWVRLHCITHIAYHLLFTILNLNKNEHIENINCSI